MGAGMVVALLGSACSVSSPPSPSVVPNPAGDGSASALADELARRGLPCADFATREGGTHILDEGTCSIDGYDVVIRTFGSAADRDRFMEASGIFMEQMSFEIDGVPRIVGPTWIVVTDTAETAEKIRQALGGEIR